MPNSYRLWIRHGAICCAAILLLLWGTPAFAQGFMVKPMKMEVSARPGDRLEIPLDLTNTAPDAAKSLELSVLDVTQGPDGSWLPVEKGVAADVSKLSSCVSWVKLESSTVTVPPSQTGRTLINVSVPHNARGYAFAGIIAQTALPKDAKGVRVVMRFLIPLIVEIQGRPERQKIEFGDTDLVMLPKDGDQPARAAVNVAANNDGMTYSRIKGSIKISYLAKDRWLSLSTVDLRETGIIPGSHLRLPGELGRALPSGKYKLLANMSIDGRRLKPTEKELDFAGDPAVTKVAVDTALLLEPAEVAIAGAAGATRAISLKVQNASQDSVQVTSASLVPRPMAGGTYGEAKGEDFSCDKWVEMIPAQFTLRPGGKQNVRIIAKVPQEFSKPGYFAALSLKGQYEDGQSAGETQSLVFVENKKVQTSPAAAVVKVGLAAGDPSKYIVQAKLANIGDCRIVASAETAVLGPDSKPIAAAELSGMDAAMLPLESRTSSAEIDFAQVPEGTHILRTTLGFADNLAATHDLRLQVSTEDGQKVVTVLETAAAQPVPATLPAASAATE